MADLLTRGFLAAMFCVTVFDAVCLPNIKTSTPLINIVNARRLKEFTFTGVFIHLLASTPNNNQLKYGLTYWLLVKNLITNILIICRDHGVVNRKLDHKGGK